MVMSFKDKIMDIMIGHPKLVTLGIGLAITLAIGLVIAMLDPHQALAKPLTSNGRTSN